MFSEIFMRVNSFQKSLFGQSHYCIRGLYTGWNLKAKKFRGTAVTICNYNTVHNRGRQCILYYRIRVGRCPDNVCCTSLRKRLAAVPVTAHIRSPLPGPEVLPETGRLRSFSSARRSGYSGYSRECSQVYLLCPSLSVWIRLLIYRVSAHDFVFAGFILQ